MDKSLNIALRYIYAEGDICIMKWSQLWLNPPTILVLVLEKFYCWMVMSLRYISMDIDLIDLILTVVKSWVIDIFSSKSSWKLALAKDVGIFFVQMKIFSIP